MPRPFPPEIRAPPPTPTPTPVSKPTETWPVDGLTDAPAAIVAPAPAYISTAAPPPRDGAEQIGVLNPLRKSSHSPLMTMPGGFGRRRLPRTTIAHCVAPKSLHSGNSGR